MLLASLLASPAWANAPISDEQLATYVTARAADSLGDPARAAQLLAGLSREQPEVERLRNRAIGNAIASGDMALALRLADSIAIAATPLDLRVLLVAEQLRAGKGNRAIEILRTEKGIIDSSFLAPFVEAWVQAERRDPKALERLDQVRREGVLSGQVDEHRAFILLEHKRPQDAAPIIEQALESAAGRADRLRLAFADGYLAAGDKARAVAVLQGEGPALAEGRARIAAGKPIDQAVDTPAKAFGELLMGMAVALSRMQDKSLPVAFAQVARYANPDNSAATLLLSLMLDGDGRTPDALQMLRTIPTDDPFASAALDAEMRMLVDAGREQEALRRAWAVAHTRRSADGFSRLGTVMVELERHAEAAEAYGQALELAESGPSSDETWALHLFRASALEQADNWPAAKAELEQAMKLSPENALVLNFLGYAKLERGEDIAEAEAMVRKASALRPDDASITDSLGWAQFKQGKVEEAIATLTRAAQADPSQFEIQEHLGDALYTAGRRYEARFAWRAALINAEDKAKARIEAKIESGLTPTTAAP